MFLTLCTHDVLIRGYLLHLPAVAKGTSHSHISDLRIRKKSFFGSRAGVWELPSPVPAGLCCDCALGLQSALGVTLQPCPGSPGVSLHRPQGGTKHLHVFLPSSGNQSRGIGEEVKYS